MSAAAAGSSGSADYNHLLKLLMVGDSGVGKTSLLLQFASGDFNSESRPTVGVDLKVKLMKLRGKTLKLTIWDTAGQERFRTLTSAYYRGAHGIILVYDVTQRESFDNIKEWLKEIDIYSTNEEAVKMLIGNKTDLGAQARTVTNGEAKEFARAHSMLYIEASAKTNAGVQTAYEELIHKIMDVPTLMEGSDSKKQDEKPGVSLKPKAGDDDRAGNDNICCGS